MTLTGGRGRGPHTGQRALDTCTSWYAYAAMFGSSTQLSLSYHSFRTHILFYILFSGSIVRHLVVFCQPQPLACIPVTPPPPEFCLRGGQGGSKGGGWVGLWGGPPPPGDLELLEAPNKFFGLN